MPNSFESLKQNVDRLKNEQEGEARQKAEALSSLTNEVADMVEGNQKLATQAREYRGPQAT